MTWSGPANPQDGPEEARQGASCEPPSAPWRSLSSAPRRSPAPERLVAADALTPARLRAMDAEEAAAWFVVRRAEGLSLSEQRLLADWRAASPSHRRALERADRA